MTADKTSTAKTADDKPDTAAPTMEWTAIPAPPKVPNYHQGHGPNGDYTLHYASPGWDVHDGTHDAKATLGPVLFHARTAKESKAWAQQQHDAKPEAAKPAPRPRKTTARTADKAAPADQAAPTTT
jgi:hypothetical protein